MVYTTSLIEKFRFEDDDYEIVSALGAGGMGTVYKARQKSLARFVAIKVLNAIACADSDSVSRLKREAAAAASVMHPNVIRVHSIGLDSDSNLPFIVMEYLEGKSLSALLEERGKLSEEEAMPIFLQLLSALAALHDAGLVHRDVKPHNVFVTVDGGIKLMDLGIVKSVNGEAQRLTQTGATLGSPAYMSPEQCSGEADLDGRSDLYSLGCTFFRVLTGSDPFQGETALEVMFMHLHDQAPELPETVSAHVAAAVAKAMEKKREDRFADAKAFRQALLNADGARVVTRKLRPKVPPKVAKFLSPKVVACALGIGIALSAGTWFLTQPRQSKIADMPQYVQRLYHSQDGRRPHELLERIANEIDKDPSFDKRSPEERLRILRPVLDYGKSEIPKYRAKQDWDELFPLSIAYARIVAYFDRQAGYSLLRQALAEGRRIDPDPDNRANWIRASSNNVYALEMLRSQKYDAEFEKEFADFLEWGKGGGEDNFRNKNIAWAHLVAADHKARHGDYAGAEAMVRKAIELRKDAELVGTIEQVKAYEKLCEELHAQKKWKELIREADEGWEISKSVIDAANDRYNARCSRLNIARFAIAACNALGDEKNAARFRQLEEQEAKATDVTRKISM